MGGYVVSLLTASFFHENRDLSLGQLFVRFLALHGWANYRELAFGPKGRMPRCQFEEKGKTLGEGLLFVCDPVLGDCASACPK